MAAGLKKRGKRKKRRRKEVFTLILSFHFDNSHLLGYDS